MFDGSPSHRLHLVKLHFTVDEGDAASSVWNATASMFAGLAGGRGYIALCAFPQVTKLIKINF